MAILCFLLILVQQPTYRDFGRKLVGSEVRSREDNRLRRLERPQMAILYFLHAFRELPVDRVRFPGTGSNKTCSR